MIVKVKKVREIFSLMGKLEDPFPEDKLDDRIKEILKLTAALSNLSDEALAKQIENMEKQQEKVVSPLIACIIGCFEYTYRQKKDDRTIRKFARLVYKELILNGGEISQKCSLTFLSNLIFMGSNYGMRAKTEGLITGTIGSCIHNDFLPEEIRKHASTALAVVEQFSERPDILHNQSESLETVENE